MVTVHGDEIMSGNQDEGHCVSDRQWELAFFFTLVASLTAVILFAR
jgi:hypothetical protein